MENKDDFSELDQLIEALTTPESEEKRAKEAFESLQNRPIRAIATQTGAPRHITPEFTPSEPDFLRIAPVDRPNNTIYLSEQTCYTLESIRTWISQCNFIGHANETGTSLIVNCILMAADSNILLEFFDRAAEKVKTPGYTMDGNLRDGLIWTIPTDIHEAYSNFIQNRYRDLSRTKIFNAFFEIDPVIIREKVKSAVDYVFTEINS